MQLLSEFQSLNIRTDHNLVFLCSEPSSEPNKPGAAHQPGNLSLQAIAPSKRASSVIWCSTLLKTEQGGSVVWDVEKKEKKKRKPRPRYHHFILIFFFPIPFFNPSDEVWTGRGMLSQTAISLHHMCLTHRMAGRRGVCREHSQEKGEGKKKYTTWNPEWAAAGAHRYPVMFCLQHPPVPPLARCLSCIYRCKKNTPPPPKKQKKTRRT